jgi:hypothetical protein
MIAVGKHRAGRQRVQSTVCERESHGPKSLRHEHALVSDGAECEDRAESAHSGDLGGEKSAACCDLAPLRSILGRHASNGIGYPRPAKLQTVIAAGIVYSFSEAEFAQSVIKQITGVISG